ncbi:DNA repair protein RadC, partial [Vibrio harveyi]
RQYIQEKWSNAPYTIMPLR